MKNATEWGLPICGNKHVFGGEAHECLREQGHKGWHWDGDGLKWRQKTVQKMESLRDQPLSVNIIKGELLSINIGIDTLAFAQQNETPFSVYDPNKGAWRIAWKVTDPLEFAKDVRRELTEESEIGSTLLTDLLDKASEMALENGSLGVEEGEPAWPESIDD